MSSNRQHGGARLSSAKRSRSPNDATCGRCFRSSHKTVECRHQIICLRCACVGHMAARCPVVRSPKRKQLHVRSKKLSMSESVAMHQQLLMMLGSPVSLYLCLYLRKLRKYGMILQKWRYSRWWMASSIILADWRWLRPSSIGLLQAQLPH